MLTPVCTINIFLSEDKLRKLKLVRTNDVLYDDDNIQELCDCAEMSESDVTLVDCICGGMVYEVSTTCNKHNLYLFENEMISDTEYEIAGATNISSVLDEIRSYSELLEYIVSQNYKKRN